jgi:hypothetical protein
MAKLHFTPNPVGMAICLSVLMLAIVVGLYFICRTGL